MSFFDPDNLRAVTSGRWIQRASSRRETIGVGIDTRGDLDRRVFVAIRGDTHDGHRYLPAAAIAGATLAIVDEPTLPPGTPSDLGVLAVDDTRRALARLALGYRRSLPATKVIAITGSSGKTTTKRLVHAVLGSSLTGTAAPRSFNNDIGVPLTLLAVQPRDRYVVVEIGANAPGEITGLARLAEPDIAVITSIGRAHLAGFGSLDAIAREKASLLGHLRPGGLAVLSADAPGLAKCARAPGPVVRFGAAPGADLRLTDRGGAGGSWWFEVNGRMRFDLALPGRHNAVNALAAVGIGRRFGLDDAPISAALARVDPEPMRMARERLPLPRRTADEGTFDLYNDAYNANPESMAAAIETFVEAAGEARRRFLVLGDMLELGDETESLHAELGRHVIDADSRCAIEHAFFVGPRARVAADRVRRVWPAKRCTVTGETTEAVADDVTDAIARGLARRLGAGDAVLLKASRGIGLERVAEALRERSGRARASASVGA
jgi:UDP-N-acetylmuramoyl-tripeptide--D-alanyl-D-alanine ligase